MKTSLVAALAGVALACGWAGAAHAQSFDDFMAVCEATGVDGDAIRAKAAGLRPTHLTSHLGTLFERPDLIHAYLRTARHARGVVDRVFWE